MVLITFLTTTSSLYVPPRSDRFELKAASLLAEMPYRFISVTLGAAVMASAQSPPNAGRPALITLVLPKEGAPLSAEQSEERILLSVDGVKDRKLTSTKVFRDSAGRLRMEIVLENEDSESTPFVSLLDPIARSVVTLLPGERVAFRLTPPASAKGFTFGLPAIDGELNSASPRTETQDLGSRVVEGIEFRGTRTELIDQKPGSIVTFTERWHSEPLQVTSSILVATARGHHSVVLKHIQRSEPESALFVIPLEYQVHEFQWPFPR